MQHMNTPRPSVAHTDTSAAPALPHSAFRIPHSAFRILPGVVGLVCLLGLGLALRLASLQEAAGHDVRGDELDYVIPAETLTRTGRYLDTFLTDRRTWTRVPLNGLLLAAAFATKPPLPAGTTASDTALLGDHLAAGQLALIGVSLTLVGLVMGLAAVAFPARRRAAAAWAGLGAACYPPFIHSAAQQLLSETLFMTLSMAALAALAQWTPRRGAWAWLVITGGLLGLAALARPVAVAFLPFVALWLWSVVRGPWSVVRGPWSVVSRWSVVGGRQAAVANNGLVRNTQYAIRNTRPISRFMFHVLRTAAHTALVTVVLLATILPWTVYNYAMYGRLLLLDTANVTAFWHYNNFSGVNENRLIEQLPNPADRQALIVREGLANIVAHPDRFAANVAAGLGYTWHLELQSAILPNAWDLTRRDADVPQVVAGDAAFLLVSLLGLAGLVGLGRRAPVDHAGRLRRALLWWVVCVLLLGAIIPYDARYRMPAAPALILFAAGLLAQADWRWVVDPRRWAATGRQQPGAALLTAGLCGWVLLSAITPRIPAAALALALAAQADRATNTVQAATLNAAAIAALPASPWPYRHAAEAARHAGADDTARGLYGQALERGDDPRSVLGLSDLAARHPEWRLTSAEADWLQPDPNDLRGAPWNSFQPTPRARLRLDRSLGWGDAADFYGLEQGADGPFRWSGGRGVLRLLPLPGTAPATAIRLRMAAPPLGPLGPWPLVVAVEGAAPVSLTLSPAWTTYTVPLLPPVAGALRVALNGPIRSPQALDPAALDARLLGAGVQWLERVP